MKNRKWLFRLVLVLLIWAFAELCGFMAMKWASHPIPYMSYGDYFKIRNNLLGEAEADELPRYLPTPSLNYIPTPGYVHEGIIQHCADGYRGPAIPLKKTDAFRILFLGGSTTYGSGVWHPDSTYPAQCGQLLAAYLATNEPSKRVEIINAGAESTTSAEELAYYHFKFRYYQPDLVVLHTGGNDALTGPRDPMYLPDHSHSRNLNFNISELPTVTKLLMRSYFISFISINLHYRHLVANDFVLQAAPNRHYAKWYDATAITPTANLSNDGFYNNIDLLLGEIKKDSAMVMVMPFVITEAHQFSQNNPAYVARVKEINQLLKELTQKHNAIWIPFEKATINNPTSWQDDCHLDVAGEYDKANLVSAYIIENVYTMDK